MFTDKVRLDTSPALPPKVSSDNKLMPKVQLFQSVIKCLQDTQAKLDPKRLIEICIAAIKHENVCPPELTQDDFNSLQILAESEVSSMASKRFSEPFAKFLSIAFMCLKGRDAFIISETEPKNFDYIGFTRWLSTNFPNNCGIATDQLLQSYFQDIKLYSTTGEILFGEEYSKELPINIDDAFITKTYDYGKYVGEFVKGKCEGYGILLLTERLGGMKYEGIFADDEMIWGKLTYKDGKVCDGLWREGKLVEGTLIVDPKKQEKYKGKLTFDNKTSAYIKQGHGEYEAYESDEYFTYMITLKGHWNNNKLNGVGEYSKFKCLKDENNNQRLELYEQYKGDFKEHNKHGTGVFIYSSGTSYEGEWKNNKKHGTGIVILKTGEKFEGFFENDVPISGKYTTSDGQKAIEGRCNANFRIEGSGKLTNAVSGEIYEGEFKDGKKDGWGRSENKTTGLIYEGWFKNNLRTNGKLTHPDGTYYIGDFVNNEINQGAFTNEKLGLITTGNWGEGGKLNGEVTVDNTQQRCIIKSIYENNVEKVKISEIFY